MAVVSVSVSDELRKKMKMFQFVNWSKVASSSFEQKVKDLAFLEHFKANSKLTSKDALRLGAQVNKGLAKRFSGRKSGA